MRGFTFIEIMIVLLIMGLLIVGYTYMSSSRKDRAYALRAQGELITMANAIKLYVQENNVYPADVNRGLPPGIEKFLGSGEINSSWPNAPWPGSVYDYENWDSGDTIQVSIRFCVAGDNATCKASAKKFLKGLVADSVLNAWDAKSSVYYCIKEGACRSHSDNPVTHPGFQIDANTAI